MSSGKVVVFDDEPFIAQTVAKVLEGAGFHVTVCSEWAGVSRVISAEEPTLVLLDYNMPVLKGDSICEILKRNSVNQDLKIVLYSSEPANDLARIVNSCGADGFIAKSSTPEQLVARVKEYLA